MEKELLSELKKNNSEWNSIENNNDLTRKPYYSSLGIPTIPLPDFHSHNFEALVTEMQIENYQYQRVEGCQEIALSVKENFYKIINPCREINNSDFEIIFANGATNCLQLILQAHLNFENEDEIIMFSPYFPMHYGLPLAYEYKNVVHLPPILDEKGFPRNNLELLKSSLTSKSRVLILTNPNNPTCQIFSKSEYEEISEIIKDYPAYCC